MLLVWPQEGHLACKKYGGWWRLALVSLDGVAPSWMVDVSASVIFPCTIKSRNPFLAPAHPGGPGKKGRKTVVVVVVVVVFSLKLGFKLSFKLKFGLSFGF